MLVRECQQHPRIALTGLKLCGLATDVANVTPLLNRVDPDAEVDPFRLNMYYEE